MSNKNKKTVERVQQISENDASDYNSNYEEDISSISNFIEGNISAIDYIDSGDEKNTISVDDEFRTMDDVEEMDTDDLCQKINNIHDHNKESEVKNEKPENNEKRLLSLSDFIIGKPMGSGQFGRVYLVKTRREHFICCLKIINMKKLNTLKYYKQLEIEVINQQRLNHPNILKLYNWFQENNKVFLILECALYGSMANDMKRRAKKFYDNNTACKYTIQVTDALTYCHSLNIIHRDLKTENILLDHFKNAKLCDFGWSIQTDFKRTTFCGTAEYIPPEMLVDKNEISYGKKVDVWALGILIFEMLSGETPFVSSSTRDIMLRIKEGKFHMPCDIDGEARDLIKRLLKRDPERRLNLVDVLKHPWVKKYYPENEMSENCEKSV